MNNPVDLSGFTFGVGLEYLDWQDNEWKPQIYPQGDGEAGLLAAVGLRDQFAEGDPNNDFSRNVRVVVAPIVTWGDWIDGDD